MRIAVINEVSASPRNADIVAALNGLGHTVLNLGMTGPDEKPELTYLHTGLMSALAIHLNLCDFVVGGCGTGQGYLNSVLQYPGMTCGLILEPLDAWLFTRINDGNCVSLALNKGYGWAANLNLTMLFEKLFPENKEGGYPPNRVESQTESRRRLGCISDGTHYSMLEILDRVDPELVKTAMAFKPFREQVWYAAESPLKTKLLTFAK